jgi:glycosyltransferase involved in cell wall biosynthesis
MNKFHTSSNGCLLPSEHSHSSTTVTTVERGARLTTARDLEEPTQRGARPSVCIVLENSVAPFDRRVWREAQALKEAGYRVTIISPKALGLNASHEVLDGIEIYRHRTWQAHGPFGYLLEYSWALICEFVLAVKIYGRTRFQVMHACNPPDSSFLIGIFFKCLGVRFIFDHHDLSPELYKDKFGKEGLLYRLLCLLERSTFRVADISIATNESYREIAIKRGKMRPDRVYIVKSCPDMREVHRRAPRPELKAGKAKLVLYLGVMERQDRVDLLLQSIELIVHRDKRKDTHFVLIGSGTEVPRLKDIARERGLDPFVQFTGRIPDRELEDYLSTADVAVAPDPATPLNDKSTMNKTLHYMAYGLPIVQYNVTEGRRSAGDASLYAHDDNPEEFAAHITTLLDCEEMRKRLGECGRRRVEERLNWKVEKHELLRAYELALRPTSHMSCQPAVVKDRTVSSSPSSAVSPTLSPKR